ncbi:Coiled-coil domain-containing protein, putative [Ricinus communis]|uniref:Zinc finger protein 830 n=1 Tax=Ricinus communis TaxID=3988 RepID=B9S303_RICCO|nr:Coiled-coil domain-containing protein, putative [Ricinus communis]|eukprot:XP_002520372.1 zinc finger protein 830 [Ricinus communis]
MDAAAKKKALFRAKLNAQKKDKRIDSPLVRYNESDQPVCRICNVVLKSESLWAAHQASRKHHEAINNIKNAAGHLRVNSTKPEAHKENTRPKYENDAELHDTKSEPSTRLTKPQSSSVLPADFFDTHKTETTLPKHAHYVELGDKMPEPSSKSSKHQSSSVLPPNFFDDPEAKRQKIDTAKSVNSNSHKKSGNSAYTKVESLLEDEMDGSSGNDMETKNTGRAREFVHTVDITGGSRYMKQVKGALPEGFFDDKEADLRARGIKLVKPDVKDEYKEFEKLIQEDLQEVDDRLEEEEIDAAEMIEEAETVEQKTYREKVEFLRKKKMELIAARSAKRRRDSGVSGKMSSSNAESSTDDEDDDDNENFAVDWRAQHL